MMNSYQIGKRTLLEIERSQTRPSLLLHACCAPCSTFPLKLLHQYFDITIFFNNSNIYPSDEYFRRLDELKKYILIFERENNCSIPLIETPYIGEEYEKYISIRKDDPEKGPRCKLCFVTRLKEAYQYAHDNKFDYFTTVMTISRQKDEQALNKIGTVLQEFYPNTKFLVHNFKKKGGQEERDALVRKYNLYNQTYCGCKFSINENNK